MYAIINIRTKKFLYGTNFRVSPCTQRISTDKAMLFGDTLEAEMEFKRRGCNNSTYKIVEVKLEVV